MFSVLCYQLNLKWKEADTNFLNIVIDNLLVLT